MSPEQTRHWQTVTYVGALATAAILTAVVLIGLGYGLSDPWTVAALALTNALAERSGVQVAKRTEMSIALLPTLFAAVLFGPLAAAYLHARRFSS